MNSIFKFVCVLCFVLMGVSAMVMWGKSSPASGPGSQLSQPVEKTLEETRIVTAEAVVDKLIYVPSLFFDSFQAGSIDEQFIVILKIPDDKFILSSRKTALALKVWAAHSEGDQIKIKYEERRRKRVPLDSTPPDTPVWEVVGKNFLGVTE